MSVLARRPLGASGLTVPLFSLGSWHTYDRMDFRDAVVLVETAIARGADLFDVGVYSAPGMPPVFTDVLFSAIVRAAGLARDDWMLSSKLWLEGHSERGFTPQLENALFRVGTEYADLVVLGDIRDEIVDLRAIVQDLASLADAGLIRAWGVNNWSASTVQQVIDIAAAEGVPGPSVAQLKYSVARRAIPDGAPFSRVWEQGVSLQASDVLEGGILAGNVAPTREVGRDPGGIRARIIAQVPEFVALARSLDTTPAQLAIAFTLTHPAVATTLFGTTRLSQLEANLAAAGLVDRLGATHLRELVTPFWADRGAVDPEGP